MQSCIYFESPSTLHCAAAPIPTRRSTRKPGMWYIGNDPIGKRNFVMNQHRAVLCLLPAFAVGAGIAVPACAATKYVLPHLAVYRGATATAKVNAFAAWIHRPGIWAEDFMDDSSWGSIANPNWQTVPWGKWAKARPGRRLILSVTLLPGPWNGSGPMAGTIAVKKPVSLKDGAAGAYNNYFKSLAENLVAHGLGNSILRLGWEFNGGWYAWRAGGSPRAFAAYWRQIVKTMRAVHGGQHLQFCWNPSVGYLQFPAEEAWPGRKYVNYIGLDIYDQCWLKGTYPWPKNATSAQILARQKRAWNKKLMRGNHGIAYWIIFAKRHHRPLAVPEWGVDNRSDGHGGMDDPYFIKQMYKFMANPANHVAWDSYFEFRAPDGDHQISPGLGHYKTEFPKSAAEFQKLFGGRRPRRAGRPRRF